MYRGIRMKGERWKRGKLGPQTTPRKRERKKRESESQKAKISQTAMGTLNTLGGGAPGISEGGNMLRKKIDGKRVP